MATMNFTQCERMMEWGGCQLDAFWASFGLLKVVEGFIGIS